VEGKSLVWWLHSQNYSENQRNHKEKDIQVQTVRDIRRNGGNQYEEDEQMQLET